MGSGHSVGNDGWTTCAKPSGSRRAECPDLQVGSDLNGNWIKAYTYEDWNDDTCQWELRDSECCQKHEEKREACSDGKIGEGMLYKWNYQTCSYYLASSDCKGKVWGQKSMAREECFGYDGVYDVGHGSLGCDQDKAKAAVASYTSVGYTPCPTGAIPGKSADQYNVGYSCWVSGSPTYTRCKLESSQSCIKWKTDAGGHIQTGCGTGQSNNSSNCLEWGVHTYSYACYNGIYLMEVVAK